MISWDDGNKNTDIVSLDDCIMDTVQEDDEDDDELKYFMEHAKVHNNVSDIGMWSDLSDDSSGNSSDDTNVVVAVSNDSTECSSQDNDQDFDGEFLDNSVPL